MKNKKEMKENETFQRRTEINNQIIWQHDCDKRHGIQLQR